MPVGAYLLDLDKGVLTAPGGEVVELTFMVAQLLSTVASRSWPLPERNRRPWALQVGRSPCRADRGWLTSRRRRILLRCHPLSSRPLASHGR